MATWASPGTISGWNSVQKIGMCLQNPPPGTSDKLLMGYIDSSTNIYTGLSSDGQTWGTKTQIGDIGGMWTGSKGIGIFFNPSDGNQYMAFTDTSGVINVAYSSYSSWSWTKSTPSAFSGVVFGGGINMLLWGTTAYLSYYDSNGYIWVSTSTNSNFTTWSAPYQILSPSGSAWVATGGIGMCVFNNALVMGYHNGQTIYHGASVTGATGSWTSYLYATSTKITSGIGLTAIATATGGQNLVMTYCVQTGKVYAAVHALNWLTPITLISSANGDTAVGCATLTNGYIAVAFSDNSAASYQMYRTYVNLLPYVVG